MKERKWEERKTTKLSYRKDDRAKRFYKYTGALKIFGTH